MSHVRGHARVAWLAARVRMRKQGVAPAVGYESALGMHMRCRGGLRLWCFRATPAPCGTELPRGYRCGPGTAKPARQSWYGDPGMVMFVNVSGLNCNGHASSASA